MRKSLGLFLAIVLAGLTSGQTWDATKPATGGLLVSADIRSNWTALAQTVGSVNLVADPTFLIWVGASDATGSPAHYTLSGAGATIIRTGTGLADTNRKVGDFAAQIASGGGAAAVLEQQLLPTTAFSRADYLKGETVSCGAWMRGVASATAIRLGIYDGAGTTYSSYGANGSWSWITVTRTIDNAATLLAVRSEVTSGTLTGYVSGITCLLGPVPPAYFQPAPMMPYDYRCQLPGTQTTGIRQCGWEIFRPGIVKDVALVTNTSPPTGAALIVDINTYDGTANTSMFSTRPTIAGGAYRGSARPDTTYVRRCLTFSSGSLVTNGSMVADIDQVGSTAAGSGLEIDVRVLQFARPLEAFLDYGDVR